MAADNVDQPIPPEAGPADPQMTCLSFVEEARAQRRNDTDFYKRAELQEQIALGEVLAGMTQEASMATNVPLYAIPDEMHENSILPAMETIVARITQGRIDSKAWPRTPQPQRIAAAEGANMVLDYERSRQRRQMKVHEATMFALMHGKSGAYTTWDKSIGPSESLQPVMGPDGFPLFEDGFPKLELVQSWGGIRQEVLSCFDYWTSGEDEPDNTLWQIRRRIVDKWTAKRALKRAGIGRDPQPVAVEDAGWGKRSKGRSGVEVLEVWIKPCAMVEKGTLIIVVDNCVVQADAEYPYRHKRLPISELTLMRVRGSPHGHTKVKDAIFQQRLQDVALRAILRLAEVSADTFLVGATQIIDEIESEGGKLVRYDDPRSVREAAQWLIGAEGAAPGMAALGGVYSMAKAGINDVLGVSAESVTGGDPGSTSSGEQLKTASALDAQKDAPPRQRVEIQWEEVDRQTLELWKQHVDVSRLVSVIGDPVRAGYFKGADLEGVDVAIEQSSGLVESPLGRGRAAEEGAAAGYVPPQDAGELRQTGLTETMLSAEQRQRIQQQGIQALRGAAQMPITGIDPKAAVRELRSVAQQVKQGNTALLLRLIAEYEQMSAMPPVGAPQPGQPAAPQPAKPKLPASTQSAIQAQEPIQ